MSSNDSLKILANVLTVSLGVPLKVEASVYVQNKEPLTINDIFDWFCCHFYILEGLDRLYININWDKWIQRLIKQLMKVENAC